MDKPHKKLDAWQKSMRLAEEIYRLTTRFPDAERYGITSQMRRAASSIPANIAEGAARQTRKEFIQFLHIARGSSSELDTFLDLAERLDYLKTGSTVRQLLEQVDQILAGLIRSNVSRLTSPISRQ